MSAAGPVERSTLAFRTLLLAYPPGFRHEYGPEMEQVFRDCCQDALRTGGASALASLWARTLLDLLVSAVSQRLNAGKGWWVSMQAWARIGSAALALGGIAWTVHSLAAGPFGDFLRPLALVATALLLIGWAGFAGSYAAWLGWPGYLGFTVGLVGLPLAAIAIVTNLGDMASSPAWTLFSMTAFSLMVGPALVGLAAVFSRGLGRRAWPVLITGVLGLIGFMFNEFSAPASYVAGVSLKALARDVQPLALSLYGLSWLLVARAVWLARAPARPARSGTPQEALL